MPEVETMAGISSNTGSRKPRALVTGGAGFVGSHLCERLLSEGYHVLCVDNLLEEGNRLS